MAEDGEIDIEGDFDFKLVVDSDVYDTNELPSKSANLLPEYTNPAWMLEQGWTMDSCIDEKSKATIEKMLLEEQCYMNGKSGNRIGGSSSRSKSVSHKQPWSNEEKQLFEKGLEIYGRSWSKIAELIPSRTGLQVKNYAQQYFKQQAKMTNAELMTGKREGDTSDPILQVLDSVTTAQPTVTSVSSFISKQEEKGQISNIRGQIADARGFITQSNLKNHARKDLLSSESYVKNKKSLQDKTLKISSSDRKESLIHKVEDRPEDKSLLPVNTGTNTTQLSPTLEDKLASSTGIIENLDGFCAVADIITGSGNETHADEEIDIDIENDGDNDDENPILKNRSASPNSVYERLLKAANIGAKQNHICGENNSGNKKSKVGEMNEKLDKDSVLSDCGRLETKEGSTDDNQAPDKMLDELSETSDIESVCSNSNENMQQIEKKIINAVVLGSGEVVEFPIPAKPVQVPLKKISEEEKRIHVEFFDGRPSKTPERYLKIRNYILDSWKKCKPSYLNKTSVRPGLKNCGDVNCIGRVHSYLECIGAINFGCEQASYNHPTKLHGPKDRLNKETVMPENLPKLESMRPRKRRIRDPYGHWVDEKELHGKTIEHQEDSYTNPKPKTSKWDKVYYDPFKLIPCLSYNEEKMAPFSVEICNDALVIMDIHAHISKTEVIGMLGGQFMDGSNTLTIAVAVPCNSISTGMQCEMDPVSQTLADEKIRKLGMIVVGWYHSHPTFAVDPSVRDIETQLKFQDWFSKGGSKFVGVIVSPYNRNNTGSCSEFQCLTISDDKSLTEKCNIPYCFDYEIVIQQLNIDQILETAGSLADRYSQYSNRVELLGLYRASTGMTCLDKLLESIKDSMDLQMYGDSKYESLRLIQEIKALFTEKFSTHNYGDFIDPDTVSKDDSELGYHKKTDSHGVDVETDYEQNQEAPNLENNNEVSLTVESEVIIYSDSDVYDNNVPISNIQVQSDTDQSKVVIINEQPITSNYTRHSEKSQNS